MVFGNPGFEEVLFLLEIHDFRHPREWIFHPGKLFLEADLGEPAIGDELQIFRHHVRVHAKNAARHGVLGIFDFQIHAFENHLLCVALHLSVPQLGIFQFDLVDDIDAEIHVHGLIAQNVLKLLGCARHLVKTAHG